MHVQHHERLMKLQRELDAHRKPSTKGVYTQMVQGVLRRAACCLLQVFLMIPYQAIVSCTLVYIIMRWASLRRRANEPVELLYVNDVLVEVVPLLSVTERFLLLLGWNVWGYSAFSFLVLRLVAGALLAALQSPSAAHAAAAESPSPSTTEPSTATEEGIARASIAPLSNSWQQQATDAALQQPRLVDLERSNVSTSPRYVTGSSNAPVRSMRAVEDLLKQYGSSSTTTNTSTSPTDLAPGSLPSTESSWLLRGCHLPTSPGLLDVAGTPQLRGSNGAPLTVDGKLKVQYGSDGGSAPPSRRGGPPRVPVPEILSSSTRGPGEEDAARLCSVSEAVWAELGITNIRTAVESGKEMLRDICESMLKEIDVCDAWLRQHNLGDYDCAHSLEEPVATAGGAATTGFGAATTGTGFGAAKPGFGAATTGFGAATTGFGAAKPGFGAATTGFGAATTGFGAAKPGFGAATTGFGAAGAGFGSVAAAAPPTKKMVLQQECAKARQAQQQWQAARMAPAGGAIAAATGGARAGGFGNTAATGGGFGGGFGNTAATGGGFGGGFGNTAATGGGFGGGFGNTAATGGFGANRGPPAMSLDVAFDNIKHLELRLELEEKLDVFLMYPAFSPTCKERCEQHQYLLAKLRGWATAACDALTETNGSSGSSSAGQHRGAALLCNDAHLIAHVLRQSVEGLQPFIRLGYQVPSGAATDMAICVGDISTPYFYVWYRAPPTAVSSQDRSRRATAAPSGAVDTTSVPRRLLQLNGGEGGPQSGGGRGSPSFGVSSGLDDEEVDEVILTTTPGPRSLWEALALFAALTQRYHEGLYRGVRGTVDLKRSGLDRLVTARIGGRIADRSTSTSEGTALYRLPAAAEAVKKRRVRMTSSQFF